ncbi:hypothetical protein MIND_01363600 [Mycena indigotica]|uniref:Uncharacterized protein n=1 Tax=Mycena indigotica TaxID=2126181 RepID=A0A8H6VQE6_9AGAR|nr:uncharacterized protein MIND_01363600 [Mycena indigotica]KAF7289889.1 hypothetical protein MIND_01363600 [Mycena indigotica]
MKQTTIVVAGLHIQTYTTDDFGSSAKPVVALFLLHGRMGSSQDGHIQALASGLLAASRSTHNKDILVITFDQRNHGTRLVDKVYNLDFETNPNHAIDMFAIQQIVGTAKDVSFLIDFLPAYIFPHGERTVDKWGVAGISLGGHSAWLSGAFDPRIQIVIPMIGCPDYFALIHPRAASKGIAAAPPHFPATFVKVVRDNSPKVAQFEGKRVLVLSGEIDRLVPWGASESFVGQLKSVPGQKQVVVLPGVGHEIPDEMVRRAVEFVVPELE